MVNSPFYKVLGVLCRFLNRDVDFETVEKYSGIDGKLLKIVLEIGFWGIDGNSLWLCEKDFSSITVSLFGVDLNDIPNDDIIKKFDKKLEKEVKKKGIEIKARTPKKIYIKTNLNDAEPQFVDDNPVINPAYSFINDTVYLTQKMPISMVISEKGVEQEVVMEMPVLIYSNSSERGLITIDKKAMVKGEVHGLKFKNLPLNVKNRWSLASIRLFLEDMYKDEDYSLEKIIMAVRREYELYMEFTEDWHYDLMSLWCIGTYFHQIFNSYPYLFLNSVKRSGKTLCLTLTGCMAFNSINALSMTPSSLFRIVESTNGTLLIDEIEKINKKDESDLRTLLLAGYKKGAEVPRVEEKKTGGLKTYGIPTYSVFSPKALANISGIEDILEDRAITMILQRGNDKKKMNREIDIHNPAWQEIRDKLYVCLMFNAKVVNGRNREISDYMDKFYDDNKGYIDGELEERKVEMKEEEKQTTLGKPEQKEIKKETIDIKDLIDSVIKGRSFELWRPIFTLASLISDDLLMKIFLNAIRHEKVRREEDITETMDSILVELLLQIVDGENYYRVKDISARLREMNPEDDRWLTTRWVGKALKRLGLIKERKRHSSGIMVKMSDEDVKNIAKKLGITLVEPVDITKREKKINQYEATLNVIDELTEKGSKDIKEQELIDGLKGEGVNNPEYKVSQLKNNGILFNPTPNMIRKV